MSNSKKAALAIVIIIIAISYWYYFIPPKFSLIAYDKGTGSGEFKFGGTKHFFNRGNSRMTVVGGGVRGALWMVDVNPNFDDNYVTKNITFKLKKNGVFIKDLVTTL